MVSLQLQEVTVLAKDRAADLILINGKCSVVE